MSVNGNGHPVVPRPGTRGEANVVANDRGDNVRPVRRLRQRVVIPPRGRRDQERRYDRRPDQGRNVAERFWPRV